MDLLTLPREIVENIFDYLPFKDLQNASLVSKNWAQIIGKSSAFRKQAVVTIHHWNKHLPELRKTFRSYEQLNIQLIKFRHDVVKLIKNQQWKKVFFHISKLSTQYEFGRLIKKLETVKELKIMNVAIRELNKHEKVALPELRILVFSDVAIEVIEIFMIHQPALKSLTFKFIICDILSKERSGQVITRFLKLNDHIRELELNYDVTNDFFLSDVSQELKLNLNTLFIGLNDAQDDVKANIVSFIKSQESSLEHLKVTFQQKFTVTKREDWYYGNRGENEGEEFQDVQIIFDVWNNLSSLNELTFRFLKNHTDAEIKLSALKKLKPNFNIKIFNIQHVNCTAPMKFILAIMKLCPNLEYLYISNLTLPLIQFFAYNLKMLRHASFTTEENHCLNNYDLLKKSNDCDINKFIKFTKHNRG